MASLIGNVPTVLICILVLLAVIFGITNLSINDIAEAAASKVEQGVTYVKHKSEEKARVRREYIAEREAEEAQREMFIAGGENDKTIVSPQKKNAEARGAALIFLLMKALTMITKQSLTENLRLTATTKQMLKMRQKLQMKLKSRSFMKVPKRKYTVKNTKMK